MWSIQRRPWAVAARTTAAASLSWCIFAGAVLSLAWADGAAGGQVAERSVLNRVAHHQVAGARFSSDRLSQVSCSCQPGCCQTCATCGCTARCVNANCGKCKTCGCAPNPRDLFRHLFKPQCGRCGTCLACRLAQCGCAGSCCCQRKCGCQCNGNCGAARGRGCGTVQPDVRDTGDEVFPRAPVPEATSDELQPMQPPPLPDKRVTPRVPTSLSAPPSQSDRLIPRHDSPPARSEAFFRKGPPQAKPVLKQDRNTDGPEPPPFLAPVN